MIHTLALHSLTLGLWTALRSPPPCRELPPSPVTTALVPAVTADRVGLLPALARVPPTMSSMPPPETSAS